MKAKFSFFFFFCLVIVSRATVPPKTPAEIYDLEKPNPVWTKPIRPMVMSPSAKLAKRDPERVTTYGKLPLSFEANHGQTDSQVQFLCRGSGYTLFLTKTEAVFQLQTGDRGLPKAATQLPIDYVRLPLLDRSLDGIRPSGFSNPQSAIRNPQFSVVRMKLIGANPNPQIEGLDRFPGISNYFIGNDPKKWRTNIPNYSRVQYRNVYPGISLVYYGNQRQLEYDLVVAPGADPSVIKLAYDGVDKLQADENGDLVLQVAGIETRQRKPRVFQEGKKGRQELAGNYVLKENRQVAFHLSGYDVAKTLVIDPVLSYSTYLGGSQGSQFEGSQFGRSIAIDSVGNAYVFGRTDAADFPITPGALQSAYRQNICGEEVHGPCFDAFVTKLSPQGNSLVYSTYLGGNLDDLNGGIALDSQGNAYVAGSTNSHDYPTTQGALQPAPM